MNQVYTREAFLQLYSPEIPYPNEMKKIEGFFSEKILIPIIISKINKKQRTDSKQVENIWTAKVNLQWYYMDPKENIQGPFDSEKIRLWYSKNQLPIDTKISFKPTDKSTFKPANLLFPIFSTAFTYNPFIFDFLTNVPEEIDELQNLILEFDLQ